MTWCREAGEGLLHGFDLRIYVNWLRVDYIVFALTYGAD